MKDFADIVIRWRWLVIVLTLALVGAAGFGLTRIQFVSDYQIFFGDDNPQLLAFEKLQAVYTKSDNVLFVVAPEDGEVFTPDTIKAVQELTEGAWRIPYSIRVDSATNFQHTYAQQDDLIVGYLISDELELTDENLRHAREIAVNEPLLVNRLISPAADVTGVNVTIQLLEKDGEAEVVAAARRLAADIEQKHPGLDIQLTGIVMLNHAFPEASNKDAALLIPVMFAVVILVLTLLLRSFAATLGTVLVIVFAIVVAMGCVGWVGLPLSAPSSAAPIILLTIAVADCVHVLSTFLFTMRSKGADKATAMKESIRINLQPVFLTSVTTGIGFLSMNLSEVPPFNDLGNIVAFGVGVAFVLSLTFLPAFMMVVPVKPGHAEQTASVWMLRFADFVVKNRSRLLWGMTAVFLFLIAGISRIELNDEFVKYFDEEISFRKATEFAAERLTGIYQIEYSLEAGGPNEIADPDYLGKVEEFAEWFRKQPEVIHVNAITDIFRRLNKNLHGDDPEWYRLPDARDMAAQYLLLYEMSLPFGLDLNNQINISKSATRLTVTLENLSSNQMLDIENRARRWLEENAPAPMVSEGTSASVMFAHIGHRNTRSMLISTTTALFLISCILVLALRSLVFGAVSIIPNLLPIGAAFGLWGWAVGEVGIALSIVSGMALGIVVDDTVHFMSKYLRARRQEGLSPEDSVRYAFTSVGTALWVTSAVLVAGFAVLTFSTFRQNADMGLLTAITIIIALITDFLLLPALLMKIEEKQ